MDSWLLFPTVKLWLRPAGHPDQFSGRSSAREARSVGRLVRGPSVPLERQLQIFCKL